VKKGELLIWRKNGNFPHCAEVGILGHILFEAKPGQNISKTDPRGYKNYSAELTIFLCEVNS
jgi:hypothetical protein